MMEATAKASANLRACVLLLFFFFGELAAGCATLNANMPAENYANQQATFADVLVFLAQGADMEPRFRRLREGMSKEEVIRILGKPDQIDINFAAENTAETLVYLGRFPSGWSWARADYKVELRDGKVALLSKGPLTMQPPPTLPSGGNWGTMKWK